MKIVNTAIALTSLFAAQSFAQSNLTYICTLDEATRIISIEYSTTESIPCAVTYTKGDTTETLWQAQNTVGYCESKAREFVEKQQGWGWQCVSENVVAAELEH